MGLLLYSPYPTIYLYYMGHAHAPVSGSLNKDIGPGELVVVTDHINLQVGVLDFFLAFPLLMVVVGACTYHITFLLRVSTLSLARTILSVIDLSVCKMRTAQSESCAHSPLSVESR